jgi:hypothetical protein
MKMNTRPCVPMALDRHAYYRMLQLVILISGVKRPVDSCSGVDTVVFASNNIDFGMASVTM